MEAELFQLLFKVGGVLFILLGIFFGLILIVKRLRPGLISFGGDYGIRIVGNIRLGAKHSIAIVEIKDKWLLIGIAPDSITLIHTMERPEKIKKSKDNNNPPSSKSQGFMNILKSKLS